MHDQFTTLVSHLSAVAQTFGTNPISVAVPSNKEIPYVLDMATELLHMERFNI